MPVHDDAHAGHDARDAHARVRDVHAIHAHRATRAASNLHRRPQTDTQTSCQTLSLSILSRGSHFTIISQRNQPLSDISLYIVIITIYRFLSRAKPTSLSKVPEIRTKRRSFSRTTRNKLPVHFLRRARFVAWQCCRTPFLWDIINVVHSVLCTFTDDRRTLFAARGAGLAERRP
jgi:hypothetical protein